MDPTGLVQIGPSCKTCKDGFHDKLKDDAEWGCAVFALFMSPNSRIVQCLTDRCSKNGKIVCESGTKDCEGALAWAPVSNGLQAMFEAGRTVHICVPSIYRQELYGSVVIHEFAHTCGWNHGKDGAPRYDNGTGPDGVPGNKYGGGVMDDPTY